MTISASVTSHCRNHENLLHLLSHWTLFLRWSVDLCIIDKHWTEERESNGLDWTEPARLALDYVWSLMTISASVTSHGRNQENLMHLLSHWTLFLRRSVVLCIIDKHLTEEKEPNGLDRTELARLVLDYGHL
jgi:hypothetical protein